MAQYDFDASTVEPNTYEHLPVGEYEAVVTDSTIVDNQAKTGLVMKLTLQVCTGKYKGKPVYDNLSIKHPNADAVRIAQQRLAQLTTAVGKVRIEDTSDLHNKAIIVALKQDKKDPTKRVVAKYSALLRPQAPQPKRAPVAHDPADPNGWRCEYPEKQESPVAAPPVAQTWMMRGRA